MCAEDKPEETPDSTAWRGRSIRVIAYNSSGAGNWA